MVQRGASNTVALTWRKALVVLDNNLGQNHIFERAEDN
jgi:hypothetical protein